MAAISAQIFGCFEERALTAANYGTLLGDGGMDPMRENSAAKYTWLSAALFGALLISSCSSAPPAEEATLLNSTALSIPVFGQLSLPRLNDASFAENSPSIQEIAALAKADIVRFDPDQDNAPWWRMVLADGNVDAGTLRYQLGARQFTGRRDVRSWSDGPVKFFAETIDYKVIADQRFTQLSSREFVPFSFRFVLRNDPAVGQWQIDSQSDFTSFQTDQQQVEAAVAATGNLDQLRAATAKAAASAMQAIAALIGQQAGVQRESTTGVVVKGATNTAYYLVPDEVPDGTNFGSLRAICAHLHFGRTKWRVANPQESDALLAKRDGKTVIDSPNFALWPAMRPNRILLDGWRMLGRDGPIESSLPGTMVVGVRQRWVLDVDTDGSVRYATEYPDDYRQPIDNLKVSWKVNDGTTRRQVLCAANS